MKQVKMTYEKILGLLEDAKEAKTVVAVVVTALASWKKKEISDYYIFEVFRLAADRVEELTYNF